ncbi:MAG: hypothetical protein U0790_08460 [Isosphaeraceae bacterium]
MDNHPDEPTEQPSPHQPPGSPSPALVAAKATGAGHDYWAAEGAGFSREDQDALIHFLLTYSPPRPPSPAGPPAGALSSRP